MGQRFLLFAAVYFTSSLLFVTSAIAASLPKASCGNASFIITNLPTDDRKVAVRINDKANGWNLENPFEGDTAGIISPEDGKYTFNAVDKHTYDWWVHIENADGTYGSAIGGEVYCGAGAPTDLKASCSNNKISLSWKKVSSAEHYAVRIDDAANPWDPADPKDGDVSNNSVKDAKYSTSAEIGHGYNVWVHAVDSKGIFSPASEKFVSCRSGSASGGGLFSGIAAFFQRLFNLN